MTASTDPQLRRFVRRALEGIQRPPIFEADDGHSYVLKLDTLDRDFPAVELVAAHLAVALAVPLPAFAVLRAPDVLTDTLKTTGDPDLVEFAEAFERGGGRCFGSRYLPGVLSKWTAPLRYSIPGADAFLARLLVVDAFIENTDRSAATNPNLLASSGHLFAIDHGQALPAVQGITGKHLPFPFDSHIAWEAVKQHPHLLEEPTEALRALPDSAIDAAIDAVPDPWWTAPDRSTIARADLRSRRDALPATLDALRNRLS